MKLCMLILKMSIFFFCDIFFVFYFITNDVFSLALFYSKIIFMCIDILCPCNGIWGHTVFGFSVCGKTLTLAVMFITVRYRRLQIRHAYYSVDENL